jgi:DNA-directed RNA polymerase subunit alpha
MMEMSPMMARNWRNLKRPRGINTDNETERYGKYVVEPLERGYGYTIGESLKRLLMSAIRGTAVTAYKVDGATSAGNITGMQEDVELFTLQLKELKLWAPTEEPMTIEVTLNKGEVYARDLELPEGVELFSPDLLLCTVTGKAKTLKLELRNGYGYVSAESHESVSKGFTAIDATFSPVTRVEYQVTDARVGQRTDYNKLALQVWTSGAITPQEAIIFCAQLFREQMATFINFQEEEEVLEVEEVVEERPPYYDLLNTQISELNLPARAENCLRNAKIQYVGELVQRTERSMIDIKNFGKKSLTDIKNALTERNLKLGMAIDGWTPPNAGVIESH